MICFTLGRPELDVSDRPWVQIRVACPVDLFCPASYLAPAQVTPVLRTLAAGTRKHTFLLIGEAILSASRFLDARFPLPTLLSKHVESLAHVSQRPGRFESTTTAADSPGAGC